MTDIVTGNTPQTIISGRNDNGDYRRHDNGFAERLLIASGSESRDVIEAIRNEGTSLRDAAQATAINQLNRTAAVELAVEKTAAAAQLTMEKTAAAAQLFAAQNHAAVLAAIAACCCEQKELALRIQSEGVRDELAAVRAEALAIRYATPAAPRV